MQSPVDAIKQKLTIQDVIAEYITIEKTGGNFKARCPFHNEKTPSFFISPDRGTYYCFGCGAKGDIFSFVQAYEGVDFRGSLTMLADKAGVALEWNNLAHASNKDRLYRTMEAATVFYEKHLERSTSGKEYLAERGLNEATIKEWRIGYSPNNWRELYEMLLSKGVTKEEMIEAGLVKEGEKGTVYDRFRGRIMFPLFDASERVIGFSGRILNSEESKEAPKYLNSPETPLFHKSEVLYGIHKAKKMMREKREALLVEGQMDLLMCHQAGFTNAVATSGTALTSEHIDIIGRFAPVLIVAYDGDNAGRKASERVWMTALEKQMEVKLISLAQGVDPADCIRNDLEAWKKALSETKHVIEITLEAIQREVKETGGDDHLLRTRIMQEVLPLVHSVGSVIERGTWVSKIAHILNVKDESVWDDVKRIKTERYPGDKKVYADRRFDRREELYKCIWGIMWCLEPEFPDQAKTIRMRLESILGGKEDMQKIEETLLSKKDDVIFQAEIMVGKDKMVKESLVALHELEIETMQALFAATMLELTTAEKSGDRKRADDLLLLCQTYSANIARLKGKKHPLET